MVYLLEKHQISIVKVNGGYKKSRNIVRLFR